MITHDEIYRRSTALIACPRARWKYRSQLPVIIALTNGHQKLAASDAEALWQGIEKDPKQFFARMDEMYTQARRAGFRVRHGVPNWKTRRELVMAVAACVCHPIAPTLFVQSFIPALHRAVDLDVPILTKEFRRMEMRFRRKPSLFAVWLSALPGFGAVVTEAQTILAGGRGLN